MTGPGGVRTVAGELEDALYYLRHDCVPCAERHFDVARALGATEEMVAQVRAGAKAHAEGSGAWLADDD